MANGLKTTHQWDLRTPPTESTNVVRLVDMIEYVAGLRKSAVRAVLTSPFVGAYNSVAKTLTQTTPEELEADGVTLALGDRLLVKGQLDLTQNGIYTVTTLGVTGVTAAVLTRAEDFDESVDLINNTVVPVLEGDEHGNSTWKLTIATVPAILDTTNIEFTKQITSVKRVVELTYEIAGDDITLIIPLQHNLGTKHIIFQAYDTDSGEDVGIYPRRTNINEAHILLGVPLGAGTNTTVILHAEVDPA